MHRCRSWICPLGARQFTIGLFRHVGWTGLSLSEVARNKVLNSGSIKGSAANPIPSRSGSPSVGFLTKAAIKGQLFDRT